MTHPHTTPAPLDPTAPTCPSCGLVAAAGTWPPGFGVKAWHCLDCLHASTVAASGDVAAARAASK